MSEEDRSRDGCYERLEECKAEMARLIRERRENPYAIHSFPLPIPHTEK